MNRKHVPSLMANDITGVQPISSDVMESLLRASTEIKEEIIVGGAVHNFVHGWFVQAEEGLIPFTEYIDKYGHESIVPKNRGEIMKKWYDNMKDET